MLLPHITKGVVFMSGKCDTKYPIVLVHGVGYRDVGIKLISYWGRIPDALQEEGARIYYGGQDSWGTIESNANALAARIRGILAESGAEKVNIIAHSKGGLDSRKMLTFPGMSEKVASLTTIATPHHGLKWVDKIMKLPKFLFRIASKYLDKLCRKILGDDNPCSLEVAQQFTTEYMEKFNAEVKDADGVYYQSYMACMSHNRSDIFLSAIHRFIKRNGGENDGLVTLESARWTNFKGVWRTPFRRGISHLDQIDFRRRDIKHKKQKEIISERYIEIISELREMGF